MPDRLDARARRAVLGVVLARHREVVLAVGHRAREGVVVRQHLMIDRSSSHDQEGGMRQPFVDPPPEDRDETEPSSTNTVCRRGDRAPASTRNQERPVASGDVCVVRQPLRRGGVYNGTNRSSWGWWLRATPLLRTPSDAAQTHTHTHTHTHAHTHTRTHTHTHTHTHAHTTTCVEAHEPSVMA